MVLHMDRMKSSIVVLVAEVPARSQGSRMMKMSKYGNDRMVIGDEVFDSRREFRRFCELKLLERTGEIQNLRRQVPYELIPAQYAPSTVGKRGGVKRGKCMERAVVYYADFVYIDGSTGGTVVEDVKGCRTEVYKIKKKLMLYVHGIQIKEV